MALALVPVPEEVARTAALALQTRADRRGGGTARSIVVATALSNGYITEYEITEIVDWHGRNPDAVQGEASTLLGGLYGGAPARQWAPSLVPDPPDPAPVTAAVKTPVAAKLAKLNKTVNQTNRTLMDKLHSASTVALNEALRQAGVKLRGRARTKAAHAALDNSGGIYPPAVLAAVGVTEQELLDKRFDTLGLYATGLIAAAERKKALAAARLLGLDPSQVEEQYGETIDSRADAAAGVLVTALGLLARQALSGHGITAESSSGEYSGPVPFSVVRQAFDVAARGASPAFIDETGPGPSAADELSQALTDAGQSIVEELLAQYADEIGPTQTRTTWVVGDPERPFEPHQALDGVSWVGDYPEELAADPSEWPYVDVYEPDDHPGCECLLIEETEPIEDSRPLEEAIGADAGSTNDLVDFAAG